MWLRRVKPAPTDPATVVPTGRVCQMQFTVSSSHGTRWVQVEPEGMLYDLPPGHRVVLTIRAPAHETAQFELLYVPDGIVLARNSDSEVWATHDDSSDLIDGRLQSPA